MHRNAEKNFQSFTEGLSELRELVTAASVILNCVGVKSWPEDPNTWKELLFKFGLQQGLKENEFLSLSAGGRFEWGETKRMKFFWERDGGAFLFGVINPDNALLLNQLSDAGWKISTHRPFKPDQGSLEVEDLLSQFLAAAPTQAVI